VLGLVWAAASLGVAGVTVSEPASASVSIAVTWDGLLRGSTLAAVVTPVDASSSWENGRIYTYTRVRLDRVIAGGQPAGSEVWVRTMGGIVGKIGQVVDGEAVLAPGQPSLLFLHPGAAGTLDVTARGQGQFPVVPGDASGSPARVVRSHSMGALVPPQVIVSTAATRLAADVLHGRAVDDVARDIAADWQASHAR